MTSVERALPCMLLAIAGLAIAALVVPPAHAEARYPDRPVRIVVPFAAGGVADITVRIVAERLGDKLGQRFYVENQPGAGGIAAARTVISSAPDGYTLALLSNGTAVSVSLFNKLPFEPLKDFAPISSLGFFDFIFTTTASSPFRTLGDFIQAAKARPGALNVGTINIGSTQNLSAELFKTAAGIDFTIVPYRATPEVAVSLLQGDIAVMIDSYAAVKGNLADGKFRGLASSGPVRSLSTPDIATVRESGVASYDVVSWNALFALAARRRRSSRRSMARCRIYLWTRRSKNGCSNLASRPRRARRRKFQPGSHPTSTSGDK
jgi:putative tricarboxylic transport membrane protein